MAEYKIEVPFSGYIRGYRTLTVLADSPEEALERVQDGLAIDEDYETVRDDTETDWDSAEVTRV